MSKKDFNHLRFKKSGMYRTVYPEVRKVFVYQIQISRGCRECTDLKYVKGWNDAITEINKTLGKNHE